MSQNRVDPAANEGDVDHVGDHPCTFGNPSTDNVRSGGDGLQQRPTQSSERRNPRKVHQEPKESSQTRDAQALTSGTTTPRVLTL
jgi:hypothetical protein